MAMVPFEELFPEVLAVAPTCPTPTMVRVTRNAIREFCERAKCYRYSLEAEAVVANDPEVQLTLPPFTVMVAPITISLGGELLKPTSPGLLEEDSEDWESHVGEPRFYLRSTLDLNAVKLFPIPISGYSGDKGLRGEVALKPSRAATGIEEMVFDQYFSGFVSGTLADLLMIPSAPWYSPSQAAFHAEIFEMEILKAQSRAASDDLPKRRTVRYGGI